MRTISGIASLGIMLLLSACASPGQHAQPLPMSGRAGGEVSALKAERSVAPGSVVAPLAASQHSPRPEPDAVVMFDPKGTGFTGEMAGRLAAIASEAKQDDRIIIRLESYVPGGGSPALDIGRAAESMSRVREHLHGLGVLPRRILLASFGSEYDRQRDRQQHWVEVYVLRPAPVQPEPASLSLRK